MAAGAGMDRHAVESTFIELSLRAGALLVDAFNAAEIETSWKGDGTPVTEADLAADRLIRDGLSLKFPDIPTVSEEHSDSHKVTAARFFLVDPLDGTSGFRRRKPEFTVNIALVEDGLPTMGVVHAPALGRHFCTEEGGLVAERRVDEGSATCALIARHSPAERTNSSIRVVASRTMHTDKRVADYLERFDVANVDVISSSLKFCLIAAGEADMYPRFGPTMEWDTAAGHAILAATGGRLVRYDTGGMLGYGKPNFENPEFIAFAPGVRL